MDAIHRLTSFLMMRKRSRDNDNNNDRLHHSSRWGTCQYTPDFQGDDDAQRAAFLSPRVLIEYGLKGFFPTKLSSIPEEVPSTIRVLDLRGSMLEDVILGLPLYLMEIRYHVMCLSDADKLLAGLDGFVRVRMVKLLVDPSVPTRKYEEVVTSTLEKLREEADRYMKAHSRAYTIARRNHQIYRNMLLANLNRQRASADLYIPPMIAHHISSSGKDLTRVTDSMALDEMYYPMEASNVVVLMGKRQRPAEGGDPPIGSSKKQHLVPTQLSVEPEPPVDHSLPVDPTGLRGVDGVVVYI
jgi:hypothetical protein